MRTKSTLVIVVLLCLLVVLAILQYRWIGQVSEAEQERMLSGLEVAARRFAEDFDLEVTRAFLYFQGEPGMARQNPQAEVLRCFRRWLAEAPYPEFIAEVVLAERDLDDRLQLRRLDLERGWVTFRPTGELALLQQRLVHQHPPPLLDDRLPAVVAQIAPEHRTPPHQQWPGTAPDLIILRLDRKQISERILPELAQRHFAGGAGLSLVLEVRNGRDGTLVYCSHPAAEETMGPGDVTHDLLALRDFAELRFLGGPPRARHPRAGPPHPGQGRPRDEAPPPEMHSADQGLWSLTVTHSSGSLDVAVAAARRRNLALSAGILLLLAGSMAMMVISARRAQRLARQQIEFVAGVSHELKTPLAAIRSAAQNLADGVIGEPTRVREYGALLDREGRRLSTMVSQLLELAGMTGRRSEAVKEPVAIAKVVEGALDDLQWTLEEQQIEVKLELGRGLPLLAADPDALRRAFHNLIDNAAKHGGKGRWIGIRAARRGNQLVVTISDRGPGISRTDLAHIFEPFYRGRSGVAQASGSGLGLSIVSWIIKQHGGRVEISSSGEGTTVSVVFPGIMNGMRESYEPAQPGGEQLGCGP